MATEKPSNAEEEYFVRQELERRKEWARENAARTAKDEQERLRALHHMKCPKCGTDLHTSELHGVTVDSCPACRGMWFDAGEVDHMLEHEQTGLFKRVSTFFRK
jgi:predicted Zn-ribbon and HTH transcriptional regulator